MPYQTISDVLYKSLYFVIVGVTILIIGSFLFMSIPLGQYGVTAGQMAIRLLWVVATPGILKRFRVTGLLQKIQIILMRSRRRLGILTFLLMTMHMLWVRLFFDIQDRFSGFFSSLSRFEIAGLIGFCLLIPLFITSNNYSVRVLKKNWGRIHKLIYFSMWLIALHVALQGSYEYAIPTLTVAVLQAISWMYFLATKSKITPPAPITTSTLPTASVEESAEDRSQ